jgi:hypothetical protein
MHILCTSSVPTAKCFGSCRSTCPPSLNIFPCAPPIFSWSVAKEVLRANFSDWPIAIDFLVVRVALAPTPCGHLIRQLSVAGGTLPVPTRPARPVPTSHSLPADLWAPPPQHSDLLLRLPIFSCRSNAWPVPSPPHVLCPCRPVVVASSTIIYGLLVAASSAGTQLLVFFVLFPCSSTRLGISSCPCHEPEWPLKRP